MLLFTDVMTLPAYDIFEKHDAALVWVESVQDLATAKKRVEELSKQSPCEYFVFDQRQSAGRRSFKSLRLLTQYPLLSGELSRT